MKSVGYEQLTILMNNKEKAFAERLCTEGIKPEQINLIKPLYPVSKAIWKGLDGGNPY